MSMLHEQKLKEVERLKYEEPSWAWLLPDMFSDVAINFGSMLGTAAARDSEDTPAPQNTSQPTSGSRKRGSSGATKSTADSPSKKAEPPMSPSSSGRAKKSKLVLAKLLSKMKADDKQTSKALSHLNAEQHQRREVERQAYRQCLQLAIDCGIDDGSEEYFFLHEHFKDELERDAYLLIETREARRSWIQRAFEKHRRG